MAASPTLKDGVKEGEEGLRELQARLDAPLAGFPNMLADDVPDGPDESHNVELRRWGEPRRFDFAPRPHEELGAGLGMDFAAAAKLSRRPVRGAAAPARRASSGRCGQFMLDLQTREHGYTEVAVPYLVRDEALFGTGQLPKFAEDLFRTTNGHWLIPTAEVPLTNLVAGEILDEARAAASASRPARPASARRPAPPARTRAA